MSPQLYFIIRNLLTKIFASVLNKTKNIYTSNCVCIYNVASTATTTIASPQPWTGDPDDAWGEWGEFGPCSVSCHGGEQMRSRKNHMTGDTDSEKRNCNVDVPCDG